MSKKKIPICNKNEFWTDIGETTAINMVSLHFQIDNFYVKKDIYVSNTTKKHGIFSS